MARPSIICLTPVKNESWILWRFLKCASLWADHIIVANQNSDDGSAEIAQRFPKVRLIRNEATRFNEPERVRMLLDESRKIAGPRLLIALDADEFITSNFLKSAEWQTTLDCERGTLIRLDRADIHPGMTHYWLKEDKVFGIMDDESAYQGLPIHSPRVPLPPDAPSLALREIKVMHYQYTDWDRMRSKHRWYQCWELLRDPGRSPVELFRVYHHMYSIGSEDLHPIPSSWLEGYEAHGIEMTSTVKDSEYWWDKEVLGFFRDHGVEFFSKLDIWDQDWASLADRMGFDQAHGFQDPRSEIEKAVHLVLGRSQRFNLRILRKIVDLTVKLLPNW